MPDAPAAVPQATLVTVDEDYAGQRLDNFLIRQLKGVPKTHVYRIIRSGEVRVNKGRAHADTRVEAGDIVRLPPVRTSERAEEKAQAMQRVMTEVARYGASSTVGGYAPAAEFPILFEDDFLLAIDKPAGVAVHGGSGVSFGIIEQLRMARPEADFLELVHRLDRETSGILLIAKRRMALKLLQEQFRERETDKVYLAELEVAGVEIVPSRFLQPSDPVVLPSSGEFVVKPTVGAGSRDAGRFDAADPEPAMAHAAALLAEGRTMMIQPYQRSVDERGETALLYFGGSFSHAINKGPLLARRDPGDPSTLQPSRALFAPERITPTSATKAERGAGDRVLEALAGLGSVGHELSPAPYVRIDLVEGDDGSTLLLEVELTEPSVFLDADSGAADRFADVLAALLVAERSR